MAEQGQGPRAWGPAGAGLPPASRAPACPPGTEGPSLCGRQGEEVNVVQNEEGAVLGGPGAEIDGGQEGGRPECGQCGQCWRQATSGWGWGRGGGRGEREGKF